MFEGRWIVAWMAGLVLVVVSVAMIAGLRDEPASRGQSPPSRISPPREHGEEFEEATSELEPDLEEPWADEEEEPAEGIRELSGIATDSSNGALEGVEIEVADFGRLRTISDEDGGFRLHSVPTQPVILVARATGYAETRVSVRRSEPDGEQRVDVSLADGDGVAGEVVDPDGASVARAQVGCVADFKRQRSVSTDRYGRFELPEGSAGCEAVAKIQGFDDSPQVVLELGTGNLLVLARFASIAGVVIDSDGHPPRSFVISIDSFHPVEGGEAERRYRHTFSNPRGSFTVPGLRAGSYVFTVGLPGGRQMRSTSITVRRGEQRKGVRLSAQEPPETPGD
ncbi:MAG: hypothetical protein DRI90_10020 [Deltaproteobacteria bacterium]|nr:MAG: hypothetical protein DRI90_10020 [Deltaproteobacteria bacterium]